MAADKVSLAEVHASARDIRIVGDLPSSLQGAVVTRMEGDVLLSFDDLNRELGASRVKFTSAGPGGVHIAGSLPVAGREITVRAEARIERDGQRAVSTTVQGMRLDVPGLFTYRPGEDPESSGLRLHREAATRISREAARIKALLALPAVVKRPGAAGVADRTCAAQREGTEQADRDAALPPAADEGQSRRRRRRQPLAPGEGRHRPRSDRRPAGTEATAALRPPVALLRTAEHHGGRHPPRGHRRGARRHPRRSDGGRPDLRQALRPQALRRPPFRRRAVRRPALGRPPRRERPRGRGPGGRPRSSLSRRDRPGARCGGGTRRRRHRRPSPLRQRSAWRR
ncbi:LmeA family phospholipid-binding protein [Streptomyces sp. PmtA]|uniref:LmeA family phospholipid-binding protein n=1 Tax=Streptomyces sp. PmtA TaxID=3074275 RepID=UPI0030156546